MSLDNSQPQCGWELLNQQASVLVSSASTFEAVTAANAADSSHNGYRHKQIGLFNTSLADHRDPLSTGPGARLIPWFLPVYRGYPDQQQFNYSSLRASSPSKQNSSTIYLSCLIEDITGVLGYDCSILYSSLSTLLLYQAPFPNPPTSIKQSINHFFHSTQLRGKSGHQVLKH